MNFDILQLKEIEIFTIHKFFFNTILITENILPNMLEVKYLTQYARNKIDTNKFYSEYYKFCAQNSTDLK
jgi:hypothetical protein